jgi:hypothetical protein
MEKIIINGVYIIQSNSKITVRKITINEITKTTIAFTNLDSKDFQLTRMTLKDFENEFKILETIE